MDFSTMERHAQLSEIYIQPDEYERLASRIANIAPDPLVGKITKEQIKQALQDYGNIWPGRARNPFEP